MVCVAGMPSHEPLAGSPTTSLPEDSPRASLSLLSHSIALGSLFPSLMVATLPSGGTLNMCRVCIGGPCRRGCGTRTLLLLRGEGEWGGAEVRCGTGFVVWTAWLQGVGSSCNGARPGEWACGVRASDCAEGMEVPGVCRRCSGAPAGVRSSRPHARCCCGRR